MKPYYGASTIERYGRNLRTPTAIWVPRHCEMPGRNLGTGHRGSPVSIKDETQSHARCYDSN